MTSVRISSRMMREGCPGVSRTHHLKIFYYMYICIFQTRCKEFDTVDTRHHQLSSCKCKTSSAVIVDIVDIVDIYLLLLSIQGQAPRMRAPVRPRHLRLRRRTEDFLSASHTRHLNHAGEVRTSKNTQTSSNEQTLCLAFTRAGTGTGTNLRRCSERCRQAGGTSCGGAAPGWARGSSWACTPSPAPRGTRSRWPACSPAGSGCCSATTC